MLSGCCMSKCRLKRSWRAREKNSAVAAQGLRQPDRNLAYIYVIEPPSTINDADNAIVMRHAEHLRWCLYSLEKAVNQAKIAHRSGNDNATQYIGPGPIRLGLCGERPLWGSCIAAFGFNLSGSFGPSLTMWRWHAPARCFFTRVTKTNWRLAPKRDIFSQNAQESAQKRNGSARASP